MRYLGVKVEVLDWKLGIQPRISIHCSRCFVGGIFRGKAKMFFFCWAAWNSGIIQSGPLGPPLWGLWVYKRQGWIFLGAALFSVPPQILMDVARGLGVLQGLPFSWEASGLFLSNANHIMTTQNNKVEIVTWKHKRIEGRLPLPKCRCSILIQCMM